MLLHDMKLEGWRLQIVATDLNQQILDRAAPAATCKSKSIAGFRPAIWSGTSPGPDWTGRSTRSPLDGNLPPFRSPVVHAHPGTLRSRALPERADLLRCRPRRRSWPNSARPSCRRAISSSAPPETTLNLDPAYTRVCTARQRSIKFPEVTMSSSILHVEAYDTEVCRIVQDVLETMTQYSVCARPRPIHRTPGPDDLRRLFRRRMEWRGTRRMFAPDGVRLYRPTHAIPKPLQFDDDVYDALGELANMIGGNLKSVLPTRRQPIHAFRRRRIQILSTRMRCQPQ